MKKEEKHSNKCAICKRPTHKELKYCIFHASAKEKTKEEFKNALKKYIEKIKENNLDYNFIDFLFIGNINFKEDLNINIFKNAFFSGATFEGSVFFLETSFEGKAEFFRTTFKGKTYFTGVAFEGNTYFDGATFNEDTDFTGTLFNGDADFKNATFESFTYFKFATFNGKADFREATFKISAVFRGTSFKGHSNFEDATFMGHTTYFTDATFESDANFFVVKFKGNANFEGATFKHDAIFEEATFENDVDFRCKYFSKNLNFSKIKTFSGKKLLIKLINEGVIISFDRANLENTYLNIELVRGVLIDFTDALLNNTKIKRDQIENHIFQEEKKKYSEAQEIYSLLKNNFNSIGQVEDEKWAYFKRKIMNKLSYSYTFYLRKLKNEGKKEKLPFLNWLKKGYLGEWATSNFLNMLYGYGERPLNVIMGAVYVILFFALCFSVIGIGNPEIIELQGTAIHQNSGNIVDLASKGFLKNSTVRNFPDSLYFSLITFTTLGYGDFRPLEGWGRILAGSEAFIGAFMMALFVYTFVRRTGGR